MVFYGLIFLGSSVITGFFVYHLHKGRVALQEIRAWSIKHSNDFDPLTCQKYAALERYFK